MWTITPFLVFLADGIDASIVPWVHGQNKLAMWRWEVNDLSLLPDDVAAVVRERRPNRQRVQAQVAQAVQDVLAKQQADAEAAAASADGTYVRPDAVGHAMRSE